MTYTAEPKDGLTPEQYIWMRAGRNRCRCGKFISWDLTECPDHTNPSDVAILGGDPSL